MDPRDLYLDLMKRVLVNYIYGYAELRPLINKRGRLSRQIANLFERIGVIFVTRRKYDEKVRQEGRDWPPPPFAHSMMGLQRLDNLQFCIEDVLSTNVPGDLIEAGVWRGGGTIFMRAVLKAYRVDDRIVWAADSFEGLPPPNPDRYPADAGLKFHQIDELAVPLEEVKRNFNLYGMLDDRVRFLKGWFSETLPSAPIEKLALMRLDGDLYESTMDALTNLYPKLSVGGYVIIDDYGSVQACREAVDDFRKEHGIHEELVRIDYTGVYWKRAA